MPAKLVWLRSEFLKTRVAHGYCSRHLAQEACPYTNICEQCDNFVPAAEFAPALAEQLAASKRCGPTPNNADGPAKSSGTAT